MFNVIDEYISAGDMFDLEILDTNNNVIDDYNDDKQAVQKIEDECRLFLKEFNIQHEVSK